MDCIARLDDGDADAGTEVRRQLRRQDAATGLYRGGR